MKFQDLRELLKNNEDKLSIFQDKDILSKYKVSNAEFINLVNEFLSDKLKVKLLKTQHILPESIKVRIIHDIIDDNIKLDLIKDCDFMSEWEARDIIESLGENGKIQILQDAEFFKKYGIQNYYIAKMISTLSDENKVFLLSNRDLLEKQFKMQDYTIIDIVASIKDEKTKLNMIDKYGFKTYLVKDVIKTFSSEGIKKVLLENKYNFDDYHITSLIASMDTDSLIKFISENKEFLAQNAVSPYCIVKKLNTQKQIEFVARFEDVLLTVRRKKTNFSNFKGRNQKKY